MFDKEIVKKIRQQVIENAKVGGYKQRLLLLGYGFARGIPYRAIERKINEDKFDPDGRDSFLTGLGLYITRLLAPICMLENEKKLETMYIINDWLRKPAIEKQEAA
jgi:hypothetical protein